MKWNASKLYVHATTWGWISPLEYFQLKIQFSFFLFEYYWLQTWYSNVISTRLIVLISCKLTLNTMGLYNCDNSGCVVFCEPLQKIQAQNLSNFFIGARKKFNGYSSKLAHYSIIYIIKWYLQVKWTIRWVYHPCPASALLWHYHTTMTTSSPK